MRIKTVCFLLYMSTLLLCNSSVNAYDDQVTHPEITRKAVSSSKLESYLTQNFGNQFANGINLTILNGRFVIDWLTQGSTAEDHPICHASHHFHNPLLPWLQSQMSDTPWMDYACDVPRYSNVTWATGYDTPPPQGAKAKIAVSPFYNRVSWDSAREYYYKALTLGANADRENYFAKTFEAIGHVLHLLEDIAVPAHTRNDFASHLFRNSAAFLGGFFDRYQPFEHYVQSNPSLVASAQTVTPSFTDTRLTDFWDTDQYNGSNPSTFTNIGLAEFSNANYFSDFTIPNNGTTPEHTFPYPRLGSANISGPNYQICTYQFFGIASVNYVSRTNSGPCPPAAAAADHFAVVSLMNRPGTSSDINSISHVWLNDDVHEQYAKELLPRAVGYSAALLNYFFRGQINLVPGGTAMDQYEITNWTGEDMTGTFSLYYDDINDNRILLARWENVFVPHVGKSMPVSFIAPTVPSYPEPKEKNRYILVFQGAMGNETGAVAARVVKLMWREEWNNGLHGNHPWAFSGIDLIDETWLYYNLTSSNISDGKLLMTNTASADPVGPNYNSALMGPTAPCQLLNTTSWSLPGSFICAPFNFGSEIPILITKNTWLRVKIDELTIEPPVLVANPSCNGSLNIGQFQGIHVGFDNGESVFFTVPGQEFPIYQHAAYITEGREYAMNIFDSFREMGIEFQEPVGIKYLEMLQQLYDLCESPAVAHTQRMAVDYIRLEERE